MKKDTEGNHPTLTTQIKIQYELVTFDSARAVNDTAPISQMESTSAELIRTPIHLALRPAILQALT